jgi:hypothetical protein
LSSRSDNSSTVLALNVGAETEKLLFPESAAIAGNLRRFPHQTPAVKVRDAIATPPPIPAHHKDTGKLLKLTSVTFGVAFFFSSSFEGLLDPRKDCA